MGKAAADRHRWALDMMDISPSDHILEIGCGYGTLAHLICNCLIEGRITAVDRSEKMIQAAQKQNAEHVSAGKLRFVTAAIHEANLGDERFDKIIALNVNVFWMKADRELFAIKQRLLPGGTVYLFNHPPSAAKLRTIADRMSRNLLESGFTVTKVAMETGHPLEMVCVIANL